MTACNIALEDVLQEVRYMNLGIRIGLKINVLAFEDVVVLLAEYKEGVQRNKVCPRK